MARQGVDLLALDENLHTLDAREVRGHGIDDRVDGQRLGRCAAGRRSQPLAREINEGVSAVRKVEAPERRSPGKRREQRSGRRLQRGRDDLGALLVDSFCKLYLAYYR